MTTTFNQVTFHWLDGALSWFKKSNKLVDMVKQLAYKHTITSGAGLHWNKVKRWVKIALIHSSGSQKDAIKMNIAPYTVNVYMQLGNMFC